MNKVLLAIAALAFTFTACEKKKSSILPPPEVDTVYIDTTKPVDTSLTISGISDVRTTPWSEVTLPITVMRNNGLEQKVAISVSGLPEGVKAEFSANSGYTTFNTFLTLEVGFLKPGTYDLKIMSASETGKSKDYSIQLVIDSVSKREANTLFIQRLTGGTQTLDSTDSVVYTQTGLINNTLEHQLYLRSVVLQFSNTLTDFYYSYIQTNSLYHVKFNVDVTTGTITIPAQTIQGRAWSGGNLMDFTIIGTGGFDFDKGQYYINYTTTYDDNGTLVSNSYTLIGALLD